MKFIYEYKKCLGCLVLLLFLLALKFWVGYDTTKWIAATLDSLLFLLTGAVAKFSVLKTSQKDFIKANAPPPAMNDYDDPLVRDPMKRHPLDL